MKTLEWKFKNEKSEVLFWLLLPWKVFFFSQAPVGGWFDSLVFQRAEMSVPDGAHLH